MSSSGQANIVEILQRRDNMSLEEAQDLVKDAREDLYARIEAGELVDDADFCAEWFGLEPDYILDLL